MMQSMLTVGTETRPAEAVREAALRGASALQSLGIGRGDTVALALRNDFAFVEATIAAGHLGAYTTPLNWHCTAAEAEYLLRDSGAKALIAHTDLHEAIACAVPPEVSVKTVFPSRDLIEDYKLEPPLSDPDRDWKGWIEGFEPSTAPPLPAPGAMVYTSGTTGRPKGVRRFPPTEDQAKQSLAMFLTLTGMHEWVGRAHEATAIIPGPAYHSTPNAWLTALFALGANIVLETKFDAERFLATIARHRATHALIVPTMAVRLLRLPEEVKARYDLSSMGFLMHGAAPCPVSVKRALIDWLGSVVHEHYGGTELGAIAYCNTKQWLDHPGTVGAPIDGVQLAIIDDNGEEVSRGATGEIFCRNLGFPDFTYNNDPDKRAAVGRDGLVSLGDVGYLDDDGFLYLCGRSSEMVNSGGVNIYPAEIEAELLKMSGVADCAVIGIPDEEFGEKLCAHVQPQEGAALDPSAVQQFLRGRLAGFKVPRLVMIDETLPREDSGKIFKGRLKARHAGAASAGAPA